MKAKQAINSHFTRHFFMLHSHLCVSGCLSLVVCLFVCLFLMLTAICCRFFNDRIFGFQFILKSDSEVNFLAVLPSLSVTVCVDDTANHDAADVDILDAFDIADVVHVADSADVGDVVDFAHIVEVTNVFGIADTVDIADLIDVADVVDVANIFAMSGIIDVADLCRAACCWPSSGRWSGRRDTCSTTAVSASCPPCRGCVQAPSETTSSSGRSSPRAATTRCSTPAASRR